MIKHITFDEARELLGARTAIRIDGLHYVLRTMEEPDIITLSLVTDEKSMRVDFVRQDHAETIQVVGNKLLMHEHHGEDAQVEIFRPWLYDEPSTFYTAETAAAFMDAIHSEVCRQSEGSDSAYSELYTAAERMGGGFTLIWSWVAAMAVAARDRMEDLWETGDAEFIECVQTAAQEFHNYITDPRTTSDELSPAKAAQLWEAALVTLAEHHAASSKWQEEAEMRAMMKELTVATRNDAGYAIGCFRLVSEREIEYTNYGGPPMTIRRWSNGLWRVGSDAGTDSPRPVGAFKIASIPIVRE